MILINSPFPTHIRCAVAVACFFFRLVCDHAFCCKQHTCNRRCIFKATRATFVGSITPALKRFSYTSVRALKPKSALPSLIFWITIEPSIPAFAVRMRIGSSIARRTIAIPVDSSAIWPFTFASKAIQSTDVSNTTARYDTFFYRSSCSVKRIIHTVFLFFHFCFCSSTYINTATPPANFAKRSCNFSLS